MSNQAMPNSPRTSKPQAEVGMKKLLARDGQDARMIAARIARSA
jgi:hypothetical protein